MENAHFQCRKDKEYNSIQCKTQPYLLIFVFSLSLSPRLRTFTCSRIHNPHVYVYTWLVCFAILCVVIDFIVDSTKAAASKTASTASSSSSTVNWLRASIHHTQYVYFNSIFIHKTNCTVGSCFSSSQHVISIRCGFFIALAFYQTSDRETKEKNRVRTRSSREQNKSLRVHF